MHKLFVFKRCNAREFIKFAPFLAVRPERRCQFSLFLAVGCYLFKYHHLSLSFYFHAYFCIINELSAVCSVPSFFFPSPLCVFVSVAFSSLLFPRRRPKNFSVAFFSLLLLFVFVSVCFVFLFSLRLCLCFRKLSFVVVLLCVCSKCFEFVTVGKLNFCR